MTPVRVLIFSPHALRLERLVQQSPAFHVLESHTGETDVLGRLLSCPADLAVLDHRFPGVDMHHLLRRLQRECAAPPHVLFITPRSDTPADAQLPPDFEDAAFLPALRSAAASLLPALGAAHASGRIAMAQALLASLGMPESLKGSGYLAHLAGWLSLVPGHVPMGRLYACLAGHFSVAPSAAERCIRTAIEHTWLRGNLTAIANLFGNTVDADKGKPTNAEFITLLAQYVHQAAEKQMHHQTTKG